MCVTLILCIYSASLLWLQVIYGFPWAIQQVFPSHLVARLQVQVSKLYKGLSQIYVDHSVLSPSIASLCPRIGVALCQPCEPSIWQEPASQDLSLRLSRHCGWYPNRKFGQFASRWLAAKKRLEPYLFHASSSFLYPRSPCQPHAHRWKVGEKKKRISSSFDALSSTFIITPSLLFCQRHHYSLLTTHTHTRTLLLFLSLVFIIVIFQYPWAMSSSPLHQGLAYT